MDNKSADPNRLLQFQNQKLSAQLEEKRRETKALQDKLDAFEQQQQEYSQTLLCVNRVWNQLSGDVKHLCTLATGTSVEGEPSEPSSLDTVKDPFIRRLIEGDQSVAKCVADTFRKLESEQTVLEAALCQRSEATKDALVTVLYALRLQQEFVSQLDMKVKESCPDEVAKAELERLTAETTVLRKELNQSRAMVQSIRNELSLAEDRYLEVQERAKKLQNELADAEQDISTLNRKLLNQRNSGGAEANVGTPKGESNCVGPIGPVDGKQFDDAELQELQELLDKRAAEYESEREAHLRTQKELHEAVSKLNDESWVIHTNLYQLASKEIQGWKSAIQEKQKEVEVLQREKDEAYRDASIRSTQQMELILERNRSQAIGAKLRELQFQKADNDRVRQELEVQLQKEREKLGTTKTVQELKLMVQTLQREIETLQAKNAKSKVAADKLDQSAREVQESYHLVESKEVEIKRLQQRLAKKEAEVEEQVRKETEMKERLSDLQAFVDVVTTYCNDNQDLVELRANEQALKQEIATLKSQLEGHELQKRIQQLEAAETALKERLDQAGVEADNLRLEISSYQRHINDLNGQLSRCKTECDAYVAEIEVTGQAYEDMQAQNMRLLQQVTERDEISNQLVAERIKLNQEQQSLSEQLAQAKSEVERCTKEIIDVTQAKEVVEKELNKLASEILMVREQLRNQAARVECLSRDLREREDATAALRVQLESTRAQAEANSKSLDDEIDKHNKAKVRGQRLEEENKILCSKVDKMKKSFGSTAVVKELQDEVDAMRTLLNCNVCHERQKNVIITKCCHMFCQKCIQRSLETRNRKCPGCGHAFSQADVKPFFFT